MPSDRGQGACGAGRDLEGLAGVVFQRRLRFRLLVRSVIIDDASVRFPNPHLRSTALVKRTNVPCQWRCMHRLTTSPSNTLRATNNAVLPELVLVHHQRPGRNGRPAVFSRTPGSFPNLRNAIDRLGAGRPHDLAGALHDARFVGGPASAARRDSRRGVCQIQDVAYFSPRVLFVVSLNRDYCTSLARSRANSWSVIDPELLSALSFVISSATLNPTTRRSSSRVS